MKKDSSFETEYFKTEIVVKNLDNPEKVYIVMNIT